MEMLNMIDILTVCNEYIFHLGKPDEAEFTEKMNELQSKLVVRTFLPIEVKKNCLERCFLSMKTDGEHVFDSSVAYEISLLFDCLFSYCNVDMDYSSVLKDITCYNVVYESGLADYILGFCERDYERLVKMVDRMLAIDNIEKLLDVCSVASPEHFGRLIEEFKNMEKTVTPEFLKGLGNVMAINDPLLNGIKTEIENVAYEAAVKAEKKKEEPENKSE